MKKANARTDLHKLIENWWNENEEGKSTLYYVKSLTDKLLKAGYRIFPTKDIQNMAGGIFVKQKLIIEDLERQRDELQNKLNEHIETTLDGDCQVCDYETFMKKIKKLEDYYNRMDIVMEKLVHEFPEFASGQSDDKIIEEVISYVKRESYEKLIRESVWICDEHGIQNCKDCKEDTDTQATCVMTEIVNMLEELKHQNHHIIEEEKWRIDAILAKLKEI